MPINLLVKNGEKLDGEMVGIRQKLDEKMAKNRLTKNPQNKGRKIERNKNEGKMAEIRQNG